MEGRAAPEWVCDGCGLPIVRKGFYAFRWPENPEAEQVAPIVAFHPKCAPETDERRGSWELHDLAKLPEMVAHNFGNFRLSRPPRAGHKGLPSEIRRRQLERAAVVRADEKTLPPPVKLVLPPEPEPPPPEPPKAAAGQSWPCCAVVRPSRFPGDPSFPDERCGVPSQAGSVYCPRHHYETLVEPLLLVERIRNGRR